MVGTSPLPIPGEKDGRKDGPKVKRRDARTLDTGAMAILLLIFFPAFFVFVAVSLQGKQLKQV